MFSVARGCEGSSGRLQTSPHRECWRCRRRDQQPQPRQPPQLPQETLRGQEGEGQRTARGGPGLQQPCRNPHTGPRSTRAKATPTSTHTHSHTHTPHLQSPPALYCSCLCRTGLTSMHSSNPKVRNSPSLTLRGERTVRVRTILWNQSLISFVLLYVYTCAQYESSLYFYSARMHLINQKWP